jgi:hypothetical protein
VYQKGDILFDKVQESEVVVTQMLSERCDEVVVKQKNVAENRYSDLTVYDFNSRYGFASRGDPVVFAAYSESLPTDPHELTRGGRATLAQNIDEQTYAFPISRLVPIDDAENRS